MSRRTTNPDAQLLALWAEIQGCNAALNANPPKDDRDLDRRCAAIRRKEQRMAGMIPTTPAGVLATLDLFASFEGHDRQEGPNFLHRFSPTVYGSLVTGLVRMAGKGGVR